MGEAQDNPRIGRESPTGLLRLRCLIAFWLFSAELEDEKTSHT